MKKLIILIVSLMVYQIANANDKITLNMKISHIDKQHPHYLCIYNAGCFNMANNKQFRVFATDVMNLKKIGLMNHHTKHLYLQSLPDSCHAMLRANQTVTIHGKMIIKNTKPYIDGMHCLIT